MLICLQSGFDLGENSELHSNFTSTFRDPIRIPPGSKLAVRSVSLNKRAVFRLPAGLSFRVVLEDGASTVHAHTEELTADELDIMPDALARLLATKLKAAFVAADAGQSGIKISCSVVRNSQGDATGFMLGATDLDSTYLYGFQPLDSGHFVGFDGYDSPVSADTGLPLPHTTQLPNTYLFNNNGGAAAPFETTGKMYSDGSLDFHADHGSYLVHFDNLPLSSYNGISGSRAHIASLIPRFDVVAAAQADMLFFQPSVPVQIDLRNTETLTINDLQVRITDLQGRTVQGLTSSSIISLTIDPPCGCK